MPILLSTTSYGSIQPHFLPCSSKVSSGSFFPTVLLKWAGTILNALSFSFFLQGGGKISQLHFAIQTLPAQRGLLRRTNAKSGIFPVRPQTVSWGGGKWRRKKGEGEEKAGNCGFFFLFVSASPFYHTLHPSLRRSFLIDVMTPPSLPLPICVGVACGCGGGSRGMVQRRVLKDKQGKVERQTSEGRKKEEEEEEERERY